MAIRDPRGQLFDAVERVLLRAGPAALTSRAVTDEAGVAKDVLHRHFTDFDAFLTEPALSRIAQPARHHPRRRRGPGRHPLAGSGHAAATSTAAGQGNTPIVAMPPLACDRGA